MENLSMLPHLPQPNGKPFYGAAASPEEQRELEYRYAAERIVDKSYSTWRNLTDSDEPERTTEEREEAIQRGIAHAKSAETYFQRSAGEITANLTGYVHESNKDPEMGDNNFHKALYRESHLLLKRVAEQPHEVAEVDEELLSASLQYACLRYYIYRQADYLERADFVQVIEGAGLRIEDIARLMTEPMNETAAQLPDEGWGALGANLSVLGDQMVARAQQIGVELDKVHPYGAMQTRMGI